MDTRNNRDELVQKCKEWQKLMRLEDWDTSITLIPEHQYKCEATFPESNGEALIDSWHESSEIRINDGCIEAEKTLIHELTHLLLNSLDRTVDDLMDMVKDGPEKSFIKETYGRQLELAVNKVTRALYNTRYLKEFLIEEK